MSKTFISYSRKDIEFTRKIVDHLNAKDIDVWVDWEGIPPSTEWMQQIQKGIEEAGAFVFIVSPDSAVSKVCAEEVTLAVKNGKRLIPVIYHDVDAPDVPDAIKPLNWIFAREQDDFTTALDKLYESIITD